MIDRFQQAALNTRLHIPLLYGIDSVHGDGNMYGATVFPHNIGLGATRDPALVRAVEHVTAEETRASGPQWTFAPVHLRRPGRPLGPHVRELRRGPCSSSRRWRPRSTASRATPGQLKNRDRVLATAKHFAGDGDTEYGTATGDYKIDQGIAVTNHQDFYDKALRQYVPAVQEHHVGSVDAVVLERRLDRGRRRQPDQDARQRDLINGG